MEESSSPRVARCIQCGLRARTYRMSRVLVVQEAMRITACQRTQRAMMQETGSPRLFGSAPVTGESSESGVCAMLGSGQNAPVAIPPCMAEGKKAVCPPPQLAAEFSADAS